MGPKKGKKGKANKDDDWGDDAEKLMEEKMKKLMTEDDGNDTNEDIPTTKSKPNKNKKKIRKLIKIMRNKQIYTKS